MKIFYYSKSVFPFHGYIGTLIKNGEIISRCFCSTFEIVMEYAHEYQADEIFSKDNMLTKEQLTMLISDIHYVDIFEADDIIDNIQSEITEYYFGNSQYHNEKDIIAEYFGEYRIEYLAPFIIK